MAAPIPIKDITPATFDGTRSIRGTVTLRWPYSRSQQALSIQLAEEDVTKRASHGQVRIAFQGKAADALKDVAVMSTLEISLVGDSARPRFDQIAGTDRDIPYKITFCGSVKVRIDDKEEQLLDSTMMEAVQTPRKTWQTPDLKRSADALGFTETWFGQPLDTSAKKSRTSFGSGSSFRYIPSTQATPASTPRMTVGSDENTPSQLGRSKLFEFTTPSQPARPDVREEVPLTTPARSRSPVSRFLTQLHPTPPVSTTPPIIIETRDEEEEPRGVSDVSRPSSIHGDFDNTKYETHGTPRSNAYTPGHVHFASQNLSAPATPRNVPLLDLASADEQEDLFRKLRASAPPKSDAGSSMVADEDNEEGVLALDLAPSILEKQAQIQEGILRRKISDEPEQQNLEHAQVQDQRRSEMKTSTAGDDAEQERREPPAQAQSIAAAYGNSHDGRSVHDPQEQQTSPGVAAPSQRRQRFASPSMTERGAAVQETIFRSKILDSDGADEGYAHSTRSIKSSIMVEPRDGRGSVDGSVSHAAPPTQPHEASLLQQQAAVQESLFREKVEHANQFPQERDNPSLAGQAAAGPSSEVGDLVPNREATLMQQQASVQEDIFRDKVEHQTTQPPRPASLDPMEGRPTSPPIAVGTDSGHGSATFAGTAEAATAVGSHQEGSLRASSISLAPLPAATVLEDEVEQDAMTDNMEPDIADEVAVDDQGDLIALLHRNEDFVIEDGPELGFDASQHDDPDGSQMDEDALLSAARTSEDEMDTGMSDGQDAVDEIVDIELDAAESPRKLIESVLAELVPIDDEVEMADQAESGDFAHGVQFEEVDESVDEVISVHSDEEPADSESSDMQDDDDSNDLSDPDHDAEDETSNQDEDDMDDSEVAAEDQAVNLVPPAALAQMDSAVSQDFQTQTGLTSPPDSDMGDASDVITDADVEALVYDAAVQSASAASHSSVPQTDAMDLAASDPVVDADLAPPTIETSQTGDVEAADAPFDKIADGLVEAELIFSTPAVAPSFPQETIEILDSDDEASAQVAESSAPGMVISASHAAQQDASASQAPGTIPESSAPKERDVPAAPPVNVAGELTTNVSFYASITQLRASRPCDLIAVCGHVAADRAKDGQKDHILRGWLLQASDSPFEVPQADGSFKSVTTAAGHPVFAKRCRFALFRPSKKALPVLKPGDVMMLHNMKVETSQHEVSLRSQSTSSWAVFDFPADAYSTATLTSATQAQDEIWANKVKVTVAGPPVEYSGDEVIHALRVRRWYEHYASLLNILPSNDHVA